MRSSYGTAARWVIAGALLVLVAGCGITPVVPGAVRTDTSTTDVGGATSARVEVDLGAGELTLGAGSTALATSTFRYNVDGWKPTVDYAVKDGRGTLVIAQPHTSISLGRSTVNEWNVTLSDAIPIDLKVNTGAGTSDLTLGDLDLRSVEVAGGAGKLRVDLSGGWSRSVHITINGGVGQVNVILPASVGARATVTTGLGSVTATGLRKDGDSWVNDAYGTSSVALDVAINAGVGEVNLNVK